MDRTSCGQLGTLKEDSTAYRSVHTTLNLTPLTFMAMMDVGMEVRLPDVLCIPSASGEMRFGVRYTGSLEETAFRC